MSEMILCMRTGEIFQPKVRRSEERVNSELGVGMRIAIGQLSRTQGGRMHDG